MLSVASPKWVNRITSLEVGLLSFVTLVCGLALTGEWPPLWRSTSVVAATGAYLAYQPGNWSVWTSGLTLSGQASYTTVVLVGGVPYTDLKFLVLGLLAATAVAYLHTGATRVEPLVIGLVAVTAGLLTFQFDNLVLLYLGLELQALSLYTLVGYYKFDEERTDSAVRYLLSGSLVSGFMLLGFARGYHFNGTFCPSEFVRPDPVGSAWVVGVLLFKLGTVPFHFWSPTVYTPLDWGTLGLVLGATKINIWYLVVTHLSHQVDQTWWPLWWLALGSVLVGAVGGYFQTGVAPLLAYSGVVNGGYLWWLWLSGLSDHGWGFGYYAALYFLSTAAVVTGLSIFSGTRLSHLGGWSSLGLGFPLVIYYLTVNLAGLPVFPGFFGKLLLVKGVLALGVTAAVITVASSILPAVYYVTVATAVLFTGDNTRQAYPVGWSPEVAAAALLFVAGGLTFGLTLTGVV